MIPPRAASVTPCLGAGLFPMGPPAQGVSPAPRASREQKVQPRTSHHIYGAACLFFSTSLCLPQQHTDSSATTTTTAAMDVSSCSPLQLQGNHSSFLFDSLFDSDTLLDESYTPLTYDPASDPGYFSAGSSLSPTSSVDSFCSSPTTFQASKKSPLDCFIFSGQAAPSPSQQTLPSSTTACPTKKPRSKYPGKKRETASEREKLRMRDLTKSLHHLRSYLPPSVVPAGQTLTKIETLRLTIRYISYLSAQLGLSDEVLEQRRSSGFVDSTQNLNQFLGQPAAIYGSQESSCNATSSAQLFPQLHPYQVSNEACFSSQQYWMPQQQQQQQQLQNADFSGQC